MKNLTQRMLLFFIGVPFILCLTYVLPLHFFLCVALIFLCVANIELYCLIKTNFQSMYPMVITVSFAIVLPILWYLLMLDIILIKTVYALFACSLFLLFFIEYFFSRYYQFEGSFSRLGSVFFISIYPNFFFLFLVLLTFLPRANEVISVFISLIFGVDSGGWLFGRLLGKSNQGIISASSNKSVMGFVGSFLCSAGLALVARFIFPVSFGGEIWKVLVLAFFTALAAIAGDIFESMLKRVADVKDAGSIVPGRGGVLDSIDSIVMAMPMFYIFYCLLF